MRSVILDGLMFQVNVFYTEPIYTEPRERVLDRLSKTLNVLQVFEANIIGLADMTGLLVKLMNGIIVMALEYTVTRAILLKLQPDCSIQDFGTWISKHDLVPTPDLLQYYFPDKVYMDIYCSIGPDPELDQDIARLYRKLGRMSKHVIPFILVLPSSLWFTRMSFIKYLKAIKENNIYDIDLDNLEDTLYDGMYKLRIFKDGRCIKGRDNYDATLVLTESGYYYYDTRATYLSN